ncbi:hypothetical protein SKAU_G00102110 [Synaphobranchus kaupii]|uniref:SCP domain-containing protein n=1 Tax=Synaphobranchus kaupii TaxID=118154 RepID=A0A9Q1FZK3_SYNKA|nr:hypothetical protein SKAU_G00102110 [Synaphobranchus kaupii]
MLWISLVWTIVFGHCWLAHCYELTTEDQDEIVEMHNYYRSQVLPRATSMRRMSWDDTLARVAAGYATKCVWEHNPDLEDTGENLYATTGPFNASKAITGWYMEHVDYTYHNNTCEEDKLCGHYTQVVWAETFLVGCSTHLCEKVEGLSFSDVTVLVCNYSPPGNLIDEWPYEEGEPCSNCPKDLWHCDRNICVAESPSVREGTTEGPQPSRDSPSPSPSMETDESFTTETDESVTPSDAGQPLSDTSSPSLIFINEKEGEEDRDDQREWSMSGGMPVCSSALLVATLLLLTL